VALQAPWRSPSPDLVRSRASARSGEIVISVTGHGALGDDDEQKVRLLRAAASSTTSGLKAARGSGRAVRPAARRSAQSSCRPRTRSATATDAREHDRFEFT
jgi:hypothetical protein